MNVRPIAFDDFETLGAMVGNEYGAWGAQLQVTQDMVDRFADLSGDRQWIHVDPERATREGPFGAPVVHGMLVLSLIPAILPANDWRIVGHSSALNYGSDGFRFVSPVLVGDRVHARARLAAVEPHQKGSMITIETAVHVVGKDKPALIYRAQVLYLAGKA